MIAPGVKPIPSIKHADRDLTDGLPGAAQAQAVSSVARTSSDVANDAHHPAIPLKPPPAPSKPLQVDHPHIPHTAQFTRLHA